MGNFFFLRETKWGIRPTKHGRERERDILKYKVPSLWQREKDGPPNWPNASLQLGTRLYRLSQPLLCRGDRAGAHVSTSSRRLVELAVVASSCVLNTTT